MEYNETYSKHRLVDIININEAEIAELKDKLKYLENSIVRHACGDCANYGDCKTNPKECEYADFTDNKAQLAQAKDKLSRRNKQIKDLKAKLNDVSPMQMQAFSKYSGSCHICYGKNWQDCKCLDGNNCQQSDKKNGICLTCGKDV